MTTTRVGTLEEWRQWCIQAEIERDEARAKVASICKPLHEFVQTCGKFDGIDAGMPVDKTAMKYANEYRDEVAALKRGEFICDKCQLRKDDEYPKTDF